MKKLTTLLVLFVALSLALTGCEDKKKAAEPTSDEPTAEKTADKKEPAEDGADKKKGAASDGDKKDGKVAVSKEGGKIDPPVEKAKIPAGAWYCDMGTVHYARMEKGDGKCPECGMDLVHMAAAGAAKPAEGGHDGHDGHDGHEH